MLIKMKCERMIYNINFPDNVCIWKMIVFAIEMKVDEFD